MTERHLSRERRYAALAAIFLGIVCYGGGPLFALDWSAPSGTVDYKMVSLAHISPERGKEVLAQLGIGTVSRMPGTNSLLVTAEAGELRKAVTVLGIVDSADEYSIQRLGPATSASKLPSSDRIADAVGNMVIGTFANPPRSTSKVKAIIDTHGGVLWAIAPLFQLQDIKLAIELGPDVLKQRKEGTRYAQAGAAVPTVQAADMAEPAAGDKSQQAEKIHVAEAGANRPGQFVLPKDMEEKLRQLRQRAVEAQAKRQSAPRTDTPSAVPTSDAKTQPDTSASHTQTQPGTPVTPPQTPPVPAPVSDPAPAQSPAPLGQSDTENATPGEPNVPQKSPENTAGTPGTSELPKPAPVEQPSLRPGQIVPPEPGQSPESRSPLEVAAPDIKITAPETKTAASEVKAASPSAKAPSAPSLYEPCEFPNGDRVINLTLPEKLPVIQLLDLVGKYLNLSYVYDPAKVMGDVTVKLNGNLQGQMKVKDLYLLLESVLQFKDLVMTRHKDNVINIVPKAEVMNIDPELVSPESRTVDAGDSVVSRVFNLKYIDTASADNLLQQMGLSDRMTSVAESKTLIVTAYAHRMARIEQLLSLVDKPGEPRLFKSRQLKYTMAQSLAEKVKALAEQLESVTVTVGEADATAAAMTKLPGETDVAWKARVARMRAVQAAQAGARGPTMLGRPPMAEAKPGVYLDADERTNRILMIGIAEQLEVVSQLVDTLDVEQQELRTLELYRIRHVDADEVARKLQELGVISKLPESSAPGRTAAGQSRITGPTMTPTPRPPSPTPETPIGVEVTESGIVGEPQVVVVESTNSLLVNATAEQHAKVASIIEYVDSEMDVGEIPYKIYPLENSTPDHLAEVLESLIQETVEQQNKEGKIEKTVVGREEKIKIVPDPNTYSLVVYASKKNQEWIASLVKQLDKRRPQVLIDVTLVEVTKTDAFNYDLNLIQSIPNLTATSGITGTITPGGAGGAGAITSSDIINKLNTTGRDRFIDLQSDSGQGTAFYGDRHINALLTAMQSKNYGRVLAKPKLLVNDNELGNIKTADITYIEKTSAIPVNSGAAGNQTTLIQTSKDFQEYQAGIEMNITPHISEGDLLRLQVELTRSDFRETASVERPPNKTESSVKTAVTVPDGSTIILGGMIKLNQHKGGSKVPLLGDIPLIGTLFRTVNNANTESKLYVFVKAEIIRPAASLTGGMEDLEKLSEKNRTAFEKHELEFQNYQDWPGVKSKAIRPPKVLDAD
jgi:type II secretory pathway component GspD/PulD (secretin)